METVRFFCAACAHAQGWEVASEQEQTTEWASLLLWTMVL